LEIADHIVIYYQGGDSLNQAMSDFADYIKQETLSRQLIKEPPPAGSHIEKYRLSGSEVVVGIKKEAS
jgi:hypothetical protein